MSAQFNMDDLAVDTENLYREEVYSDMKAATIRRLVPVKADGTDDTGRDAFFSAQTSIMSPMGVIPLQARLEATDFSGAISEFPQAIKKAMDELIEQAKEVQRQEASRIVVPDAGAAGAMGGGQPGRIQI